MALTTVLYCSCWHCGVPCINPMQIAPMESAPKPPPPYTHIKTYSNTSPSILLRDIISYKQWPDRQKAKRQFFLLFYFVAHKSKDHICCCLLRNYSPKHVSFISLTVWLESISTGAFKLRYIAFPSVLR